MRASVGAFDTVLEEDRRDVIKAYRDAGRVDDATQEIVLNAGGPLLERPSSPRGTC